MARRGRTIPNRPLLKRNRLVYTEPPPDPDPEVVGSFPQFILVLAKNPPPYKSRVVLGRNPLVPEEEPEPPEADTARAAFLAFM
jgi:hypothetical protein